MWLTVLRNYISNKFGIQYGTVQVYGLEERGI